MWWHSINSTRKTLHNGHNYIYWDAKAQRRRAAKHHVADELQYGDPPDKHSAASKHLIEIVSGTLQQDRRTDILLEKIPEDMEATDQTLPDLITRTLEDNPLPTNATAAKAKFEHPTTDELHRQLQLLDVTLNILKPLYLNNFHLRAATRHLV
jgi:hypothetical protein